MVRNFTISVFTLLTLLGFANSKLQNFEGSIHLKKETVYDTSFLKIQVKENHIRLEEFDSKKNLVSTLIINLENEKVYAVSPQQQLFCELKPTEDRLEKKDTVVIRTENKMMLEGHCCCQMRVKSVSRNSEVTFWVVPNNFAFFQAMNKILSSVKSDLNIFSYFPSNSGIFPMMIVERNLFRKEKMRVSVTQISSMLISENTVTIPRGYQKIEP